MRRREQQGIVHVALAGLLVGVLLVVVGGGLYVNHKNQAGQPQQAAASDKKTETPAAKPAADKPIEMVQKTLRYSKLSLNYDPKVWAVQLDQSRDDPTCGGTDNFVLAGTSGSQLVGLNLGNCGKGGGTCSDVMGCKIETKQLGVVKLSADRTAYVLAHRISRDDGDNWESPTVYLTDKAECNDFVCGLDVAGLESNPGIVSTRTTQGVSVEPVASLDAYEAKPETKAAVAVFKTLRYQP